MRPLIAEIRLDHLLHNYRIARARHPGPVWCAVKADAYGHGAVACATALSAEADGFVVACLEEALALRSGGITLPILLLEGVFDAHELVQVQAHGLSMVIKNQAQLNWLLASDCRDIDVWLKLNSGMNRAGFEPEDYRAAYDRLASSGRASRIVLMTHFASADEPDSPQTAAQLAVFHATTEGLPGPVSLANSAGILAHASTRQGIGRAGILVYGASPLPEDRAGLLPVMRLKSRVFNVRNVAAGEPVGYGGRFLTERPSRIGLVACGYADGYPRSASHGAPVAVDGIRTRIIGRVSMDMLTVDLTDLPESGAGSEVELWGDVVGVDEVAAFAGTISYELLCNVKRARFVWI